MCDQFGLVVVDDRLDNVDATMGKRLYNRPNQITLRSFDLAVLEGRIKLIATLEDSKVEAGKDGMPPSVETRQLSINAMLTPGEPLEVGRIEGIRDRSGFVEVEAEILP